MNISSGIINSAQKVVIYGPEGIGKSTFASRFPDPLFIDTEGSTKKLNVRRFDKPTSWEMLKSQIQYVIQNKPCKSLIIDTADWAESMCLQSICDAHQKNSIEAFGYGTGYVYEKEEFARFLNLLEEVISSGINVVLTAHALLRKFEQPDELGSYDRWELKLGKKTTNLISPMIKEWADMVLFANYKTLSVVTATDSNGKATKHKAQGGKRVMFTAHHPCWDAKNRDGLPEECDFDYSVIAHIIPDFSLNSVAEPVTPVPDKLDAIIDEPKQIQSPEPVNSKPNIISNDIPKALADLMSESAITEDEIKHAVADKGYFPVDTPIPNYGEAFINGVLIGAWPQIRDYIINHYHDEPF